MAKYKITSLNYITSGNGKTLVNMDIQRPYNVNDPLHFLSTEVSSDLIDITTDQGEGFFRQTEYIKKDPDALSIALAQENLSTDLVLNEQQKYYSETNGRSKDRIQLILSCCTEEMRIKREEFNKKQNQLNVTYNLDKSDTDKLNKMDNTFPMYDMKDVCVREKYPTINEKIKTYRENVYLPSLTENPIGFCQTPFDKETYMLTEATKYRPSYLYSDINDSREEQSTSFNVGIKNTVDSTTYLYDPEILKNLTMKNMDDISAFTVMSKLKNIHYNHVSQIPTSLASEPISGDVLAQNIFPCKNAYDSQYSMNMSSDNSLLKCREYCGINYDSDIVYMKYYDNIDYHNRLSDAVEEKEMDIVAHNGNSDLYPYQKIECMNSLRFSKSSKHKSNLFSVRFNNSNLIDENNDEVVKVQKEIKNAIREIVKNVCPANVQLFDVMFTGS